MSKASACQRLSFAPRAPRPCRQLPRRRLASAVPTLRPRSPPTGRPAGRPPSHRRPGREGRRHAPRMPARGEEGCQDAPTMGLPLGPGRHAWSSHCPPARCAWLAAAVRLPAGRRWPGGFSPHYILSDPTWAEKCPATLKVAKKLPWGRGLLCKWYVHGFFFIQSGPVVGTFRPRFLTWSKKKPVPPGPRPTPARTNARRAGCAMDMRRTRVGCARVKTARRRPRTKARDVNEN